MIQLVVKRGILIVEGSPGDEIFEWDRRVFFTAAAGYEIDSSGHRYLFRDEKRLMEALRDTVGYLQDEGIKFEPDLTAAGLIQQLHVEETTFEESSRKGLSAKIALLEEDAQTNLIRRLKPHQQQGIRHLLAVQHGANFSVPGSGKTTVVYGVFDVLLRKKAVDKLIVVGPRSCFLPWEEESSACFNQPLRIARLTGIKATRLGLYLRSQEYDLFLSTYQTAANDLEDIIGLCKKHKCFVVVDESHNIKRFEAGVWSDAMLTLAPFAARRAILSGTPVPNDYTDLWNQITFLWPGEQVLGNRNSYRHKCEDSSELASVREALRPFFFRVPKSELDLPKVTFSKVKCDLNTYQASIYRALSVRFLREIDLEPEDRQRLRLWRRAKLVRLLQAASNPALLTQYSEEFDIPPISGEGASVIQLIDNYTKYEMPAKVTVTNELVRDLLLDNHKVVVWTSFVHNIRMLSHLLKDLDPLVVYGAVPRDESEDVEFNREQQIRRFKTINSPAVLIANPAACAESISLHRVCHHAVYLDRTFNCGQYMQSLDRIHRIGLESDEVVTYHILVARNTIDETVDRRLNEKQAAMFHLLEDELPVGTFETEEHQMEQSEDEETVDFQETVKDMRKRYGTDTASLTPANSDR
jgi:SNF2 family DNA or RNA helicase